MAKRKVSNPLALAVLTLLQERPMHPYEMASTLRERGKEHTVKLNYGSLYTVVEALQRAGFVRAHETVREGRRPERTVYEITDPGRAEVREWLRQLLGQPAKEYPQFVAGLTFMPVLPPAEAIEVLGERAERLAKQIDEERANLAYWSAGSDDHPPLARLFLIEGEFELAMREAELGWLRELIRDLDSGTFDGLRLWEDFHRQFAQREEEGAERT